MISNTRKRSFLWQNFRQSILGNNYVIFFYFPFSQPRTFLFSDKMSSCFPDYYYHFSLATEKFDFHKEPPNKRLCGGCGCPINDRFLLKALDRYWHEDCLKCGCCECRLGEVGSTLYTKANLILCRRDYLRWVFTSNALLKFTVYFSDLEFYGLVCRLLPSN